MFATAAVIVFILDRVSKSLVSASIAPGGEVSLPGRLVFLQNVTNSGAAFGVRPMGSAGFLVISIVVAVALIVYVARNRDQPVWTMALLGLILGGTAGNGFDRLVHGAVTDFIALHFFPVFNVADSAITSGVALLLLSQVLARRGPELPRDGS